MLKGYKTYITAALGALTAFAAWLSGDMELAAMAQAVFTAALAVFIRAGVKTDTTA